MRNMAKQNSSEIPCGGWTLNEIKNLIGIINKNKIQEFDLEQGDIKIHVVTQYHIPARQENAQGVIPQMVSVVSPQMIPGIPQQMPVAAAPPQAGPQAQPEAAATPVPEAPAAPKEDENLVEIKSPMVGTFYRAPSPESPPYVETGDRIAPDSVLCIVEAMKLMNEIQAEMRGTIVEILVENGQPVEYGQPMFKVKP
jgi:acetyl-CoA carboxylase biotin carboxyl carrier protein